MADLIITSAVTDGTTITVTGTGFTATTTTFTINDEVVDAKWESGTEVTIDDDDNAGDTLKAVKGVMEAEVTIEEEDDDVSQTPRETRPTAEPDKTATPDFTPGSVSEDDVTSDASVEDLSDAANTPASDPLPPEVEPVKVETIQSQGIGPRDPYPTGNPPAPLSHAQITGAEPMPDADRDVLPAARP